MALTPPSSHGGGSSIGPVAVSGTPAAGDLIVATSSTTAVWEAAGAASLQALLIAGPSFVGSQQLGQASPFTGGNITQLSIQGAPQIVGAMGTVCSVGYASPCDVPDISDAIDTQAFLYVTDAAGANSLSVNGGSSQATPIVGNGVTIDWTGTTATIVGVDLTWDDAGATVTSTAGGIYFVTLVVNCAPD